MARVDEFLDSLPNGFETQIHAGSTLSGGQRQRVCLARAFVKNAPILILDEATSVFDPEGEKRFIEDCRATLGGKTVLLITHRPASLALADRVVRWQTGKIA